MHCIVVLLLFLFCLPFVSFAISRKDGRKRKLKTKITTTAIQKEKRIGLSALGVEGSENFITLTFVLFNMYPFISLLVLFQREHLSKRKRHLSISKGSDLQEADYYDDVKPQPLCPLKKHPKLPQTFQDSSARVYKKATSIREFEMPLLGNLVFERQFMAASAMYGCFMTMSGSFCSNTKLPDNFRVSLYIVLRILTW